MNRVVRQHVPASALPEELREGIPGDALVTVTVEEEARKAVTARDLKRRLDARRALHPRPDVSAEEAVDRIRTLREEWER